ncbi:MAG: nucleotide sugar dehydrogenase [Candidatus Ratteibacteria bacterium]
MSAAKEITLRFKKKKATIGIIGLGYVGLPLVVRFAEEGFTVYGFDTDPEKIKNLRKKQSYISHIPSSTLSAIADRLIPTTDMSLLKKPDALIICVPTPLSPHREPDLTFVRKTAQEISTYIRKGQLVSLESTTYPGTTREVILPLLTQSHLKPGKDIFIVYSPEREDPGNSKHHTASIPKVVGGITTQCQNVGIALYESIVTKVIPVSSVEVAEATKLLENIFRSVNIALVNEMKVLFEKMGISIWEIIHAATTKPFGYMPFYPGPGLGGHCIPIDPFYLTWKAREFDFNTRFIELAGEINTRMPYYVVERLSEALSKQKKPLYNSKILIIGVAYKKDVDDIRESPGLRIMRILENRGARPNYYDPYVPQILKSRQIHKPLYSVPLTAKVLQSSDAVIIVTDHTSLDYQKILKESPLIIDTRNVYGTTRSKKIVTA